MDLKPAYSTYTHYYGLFNRIAVLGVVIKHSGWTYSQVYDYFGSSGTVYFKYFGFARPPFISTLGLARDFSNGYYYTVYAGVSYFYFNSDGVCIAFKPMCYLKRVASENPVPYDEVTMNGVTVNIGVPFIICGIPVFTKNRTVASSQIAYSNWT